MRIALTSPEFTQSRVRGGPQTSNLWLSARDSVRSRELYSSDLPKGGSNESCEPCNHAVGHSLGFCRQRFCNILDSSIQHRGTTRERQAQSRHDEFDRWLEEHQARKRRCSS